MRREIKYAWHIGWEFHWSVSFLCDWRPEPVFCNVFMGSVWPRLLGVDIDDRAVVRYCLWIGEMRMGQCGCGDCGCGECGCGDLHYMLLFAKSSHYKLSLVRHLQCPTWLAGVDHMHAWWQCGIMVISICRHHGVKQTEDFFRLFMRMQRWCRSFCWAKVINTAIPHTFPRCGSSPEKK